MKFLILILVLAISAQPLQAGFCDMDMEKSQKTSHHMEHYDHDAHDFCVSDDTGLQKGVTTRRIVDFALQAYLHCPV
jgi:hypothetical protein